MTIASLEHPEGVGRRAMKIAVILARFLLAVLFLAAGALKGMHPKESVLSVGSYHLTPDWISIAAGISLPGIEVVLGASMLTGFCLRGATVVSGTLGILFAGGVISAIVRNLDTECGCFGNLAITPRADFRTLGLEVAIVLLSALVLVKAHSTSTRQGIQRSSDRSVHRA